MTEDTRVQRLLMNRQHLEEMRLEEFADDPNAQPGEVVLKLDRFALTTSNITYAVYGEVMNYWAFFPVETSGWGQLPVWGYADVIASDVGEIEPGQRYFGYFPAASHLRVRPGKTSRVSFRDDSPHRQQLPEVYNWYQRSDSDPFHAPDTEPLHAIYRPLFITAFYQYVTHPDRQLLIVTESRGLASAQSIIADMLQGKIDPGEGHVIRL